MEGRPSVLWCHDLRSVKDLKGELRCKKFFFDHRRQNSDQRLITEIGETWNQQIPPGPVTLVNRT